MCIKNGGYTVAILGNGLGICYPSEHSVLMERIIENGLVISEYPPGTKPTKFTSPRRNRLISAWSDQVAVIAPGKRSRALITAEYGRKYGREGNIVNIKEPDNSFSGGKNEVLLPSKENKTMI